MEYDKSTPIMVLDSDDAWMDDQVKKKVWTGPLDQAVRNGGRDLQLGTAFFNLAHAVRARLLRD